MGHLPTRRHQGLASLLVAEQPKADAAQKAQVSGHYLPAFLRLHCLFCLAGATDPHRVVGGAPQITCALRLPCTHPGALGRAVGTVAAFLIDPVSRPGVAPLGLSLIGPFLGPGRGLSWLECHPIHRKVAGSIPQLGCLRESTFSLSHQCFSLSLSLSLSLPSTTRPLSLKSMCMS